MKSNLNRIAVVANIAPHYRRSLWLKLLQSEEFEFHFYFSTANIQGIKQIDFNDLDIKPYDNRLHANRKDFWWNKKILVWQHGVIRNCFKNKYDFYVFNGDMYCISTWIAAIILRLKGLPVIFWGHGLYGNEGKLKLFIRNIFYRLAGKHILYGRHAKKLMINWGFQEKDIYVVFNSLDYSKHKKLCKKNEGITKSTVFSVFKVPNLPTIIFIGRLTPSKKIELLIKAINRVNGTNTILNLIIIGDGEKRPDLERLGKKGIEDKWLYFHGACYDEEELSRYLYLSDLCVSPGNVGLNAIHSLSYGTPVCTHNNLYNQGPEVESIEEGFNGYFFKEGDEDDLTNTIGKWLEGNHDRSAIRENCRSIIDKNYNPSYQLKVINRLLYGQSPEI